MLISSANAAFGNLPFVRENISTGMPGVLPWGDEGYATGREGRGLNSPPENFWREIVAVVEGLEHLEDDIRRRVEGLDGDPVLDAGAGQGVGHLGRDGPQLRQVKRLTFLGSLKS